MPFHIRPLRPEEYPLLEDFLYEAVFVPPGAEPPPRDILRREELQVYIRGFGSGPADVCLAAAGEDGAPVGAAWARVMDDYGHLDDETPSLAIALYPPYRGRGLGTALLRGLFPLLAARGYRRVSLSVQKANPALRLYLREGFSPVRETSEESILARPLP